jgi:hypothetical protein
VAISNARLREVSDTHVRFEWKDYADSGRAREMRLGVDEFVRRFLLHVLPKGFVRIRHYGLLAGANVASKLEQCRRLLGAERPSEPARPAKTWVERLLEWTGQEAMRCPRCRGPLTRRELSELRPCQEEPHSPAADLWTRQAVPTTDSS